MRGLRGLRPASRVGPADVLAMALILAANEAVTNVIEHAYPRAASFQVSPYRRTPLGATPYTLRHACVSTWLNGGVPPTQVAEWAGHSVEVLLKVYAKCLDGQNMLARRRVLDALGYRDL